MKLAGWIVLIMVLSNCICDAAEDDPEIMSISVFIGGLKYPTYWWTNPACSWEDKATGKWIPVARPSIPNSYLLIWDSYSYTWFNYIPCDMKDWECIKWYHSFDVELNPSGVFDIYLFFCC